uniref:Uncharacterized protein n=1 Tax=Cacopsylla melanoneura TaxID=428564 RepID=A0A8D9B1Y6_9HEMI
MPLHNIRVVLFEERVHSFDFLASQCLNYKQFVVTLVEFGARLARRLNGDWLRPFNKARIGRLFRHTLRASLDTRQRYQGATMSAQKRSRVRRTALTIRRDVRGGARRFRGFTEIGFGFGESCH